MEGQAQLFISDMCERIGQSHQGICFVGSAFFYPTAVTTGMKHFENVESAGLRLRLNDF